MARIAELVVDVYAVAEGDLWVGGRRRTTPGAVRSATMAGELVVARSVGAIVACIHVQRLAEDLSGFGMLAVHPAARAAGLGGRLVAFAEAWSSSEGRRTMQLDVLVPRGWTHPGKERLLGWYRRLGYLVVRTDPMEEAYPALVPSLSTPCDRIVHHKALGA